MAEVILIGRKADEIDQRLDELLDGIAVELSKFDTVTLRAMAQRRYEIHQGGWMEKCILEYVDVWR